jgi:hypothetical protein
MTYPMSYKSRISTADLQNDPPSGWGNTCDYDSILQARGPVAEEWGGLAEVNATVWGCQDWWGNSITRKVSATCNFSFAMSFFPAIWRIRAVVSVGGFMQHVPRYDLFPAAPWPFTGGLDLSAYTKGRIKCTMTIRRLARTLPDPFSSNLKLIPIRQVKETLYHNKVEPEDLECENPQPYEGRLTWDCAELDTISIQDHELETTLQLDPKGPCHLPSILEWPDEFLHVKVSVEVAGYARGAWSILEIAGSESLDDRLQITAEAKMNHPLTEDSACYEILHD